MQLFLGKQDGESAPKFQIIKSPYWTLNCGDKSKSVLYFIYNYRWHMYTGKPQTIAQLWFCNLFFYIQPPIVPFCNVLYWLCSDISSDYFCWPSSLHKRLNKCTALYTSLLFLYQTVRKDIVMSLIWKTFFYTSIGYWVINDILKEILVILKEN